MLMKTLRSTDFGSRSTVPPTPVEGWRPVSFFTRIAPSSRRQGMAGGRLGVGFIGSGFITRFHIKSWIAVRDADVRGVWSPQAGHAEEAAALARSLRVGEARAFASIEEMVAAPEIDCIWICGPNHARIENMERIVDALSRGAKLVGIACENPLALNAAEARRKASLAAKAGALHGSL